MIKYFSPKNNWLILVFVFFGSVFASISFINHFNFRTYGWDLGINQNAIFDYAHFRWNDCMIMQPSFDNVLADHFSLYPILVSPYYFLAGWEYTNLSSLFLEIISSLQLQLFISSVFGVFTQHLVLIIMIMWLLQCLFHGSYIIITSKNFLKVFCSLYSF